MEIEKFKALQDGDIVAVSAIGSYNGLSEGTIVTRSKTWLDDDQSVAFKYEDDLFFFFDEDDVVEV